LRRLSGRESLLSGVSDKSAASSGFSLDSDCGNSIRGDAQR
jgi:hypothetical protein